MELLNVVESTTFTEPPDNVVGVTLDRANANGLGGAPCGLTGAALSGCGSADEEIQQREGSKAAFLSLPAGKMYNSLDGTLAKAETFLRTVDQ